MLVSLLIHLRKHGLLFKHLEIVGVYIRYDRASLKGSI